MPTTLYDLLMDAPDAPQIVQKVQHALQREQQARNAFYQWLSDEVKAEFINGEVVVHSPVKRAHLIVSENLFSLLRTYVLMNQLGVVSVEKALIALSRNDYEPDLCFWTNEQAANFTEDTLFHPAPTLVVEILSNTTKANDKGVKFKDYAQNGIPEYWIIDPQGKTLEQYHLTPTAPDTYTLLKAHTLYDTLQSKVVRGFEIPVLAIFEAKENLKALQGMLDRSDLDF